MMDFMKVFKEQLTRDNFHGFWLTFVWILMLVNNQGAGFSAGVNQFMFLLAIGAGMNWCGSRIWRDNNKKNAAMHGAAITLTLAILWTINVWPTIVAPWMWYNVCIAVGVWLNFAMFLMGMQQE